MRDPSPTIISRVLIPATAQFGGGQYDLVSLADVKLELNFTDTTNDAWLSKVVTRTSMAAKHFCNRTFQIQTYEDRFWAYRDPYPWQVPGGFQPLQLKNWPLASIPSPAETAPPLPPILSYTPGGSAPAQIFYVRATYLTTLGETACSLETDILVPSGQLLIVAAPGLDRYGFATGWNAYVSTTSFAETLQNVAPIGVNSSFTMPSSGLVAGAAPPTYVSIVENAQLPPPANNVTIAPQPLAEGIDFLAQKDLAQLSRLFPDNYVRAWPALPLVVQYQAGFATIPDDVQDAVILMVKARWFSRVRDPMLRQENVEGVYSANYWFATGPGGEGDLPPDVCALLERYRVPVMA